MPTATKVGISARDIVDNYNGPDLTVTDEQLRALQFQVDSGAPAYLVDYDENRYLVNPSRLNIAKQKISLVEKGLSPEKASEMTTSGSADEGSKGGGIKTDPVIIQRVVGPSANSEAAAHQMSGPSPFVAAQSESIAREVNYRASIGGPSLRHDLIGWTKFKADQLVFKPLSLAFGWKQATAGSPTISGANSSITGGATTSAGQGIGVSSTAQIGSAPRTISSVGAPVQEMVSGASGGSAGPQSFPVSSSTPGGPSQERGIIGAGPIGASAATSATSPGGGASGAVAGLKSGASGGVRNFKNGLGEKAAGLKSGITGGIGGLKNGLGGMAGKLGGGLAGKAAWAVDKAKTIAGAIAGNPLDIAKLGVDAIKTAWANKEKIIGGAMGVVAMPFLAMYAAIAPILGFLSGVAAGVGSALASLAGIGSAVGGAFGGLGAALATPAFGIGVLSAGVVTFTTISATEQVARNEVIFGGQDTQSQEIVVEKTANPTEVDNDKEGSVVYTVKLANNSGTDVDIKYDDSKITVTGAAAGKTLTVPTANSPIPIKLSKSNDQSNPIVITYQPLKIPAGQFNDSQITNTASVTFADPTTNEEKTVTDEATVSIGGVISHPFGFPVSGILTSVDEAPCGDHDAGLFYGVSHDKIHGLDIRPADIPSARVLSTVVGEVVSAEWRPQDVGGYVEILSKDGNFIAGYQHLYKPAVKKGDQVERGTFLGTIFNDILPDTTGPHLHYHVLQKINGSWKYVYFSDPSRAGACMADPVDSAEANIVPYVLTKPWFDRNTCAKGQTPTYTPTGPVVQDVVCK